MFLKCFEKEKIFLSQTMPKMNFPLYLSQTVFPFTKGRGRGVLQIFFWYFRQQWERGKKAAFANIYPDTHSEDTIRFPQCNSTRKAFVIHAWSDSTPQIPGRAPKMKCGPNKHTEIASLRAELKILTRKLTSGYKRRGRRKRSISDAEMWSGYWSRDSACMASEITPHKRAWKLCSWKIRFPNEFTIISAMWTCNNLIVVLIFTFSSKWRKESQNVYSESISGSIPAMGSYKSMKWFSQTTCNTQP